MLLYGCFFASRTGELLQAPKKPLPPSFSFLEEQQCKNKWLDLHWQRRWIAKQKPREKKMFVSYRWAKEKILSEWKKEALMWTHFGVYKPAIMVCMLFVFVDFDRANEIIIMCVCLRPQMTAVLLKKTKKNRNEMRNASSLYIKRHGAIDIM